MMNRRSFVAASVAALAAVFAPAVSFASSASSIGSYNINVDAAGNVTLTRPTMIWHPTPTPTPTYQVTDARSAALLKALAPASVSLSGRISGNTIKVNYVNGTLTTGSSFNGVVPLYGSAGASAAYRVLPNGDQVMILGAAKVGAETWLHVRSKAAKNFSGWVKIENVSYRIYFALAAPAATPGAAGVVTPH